MKPIIPTHPFFAGHGFTHPSDRFFFVAGLTEISVYICAAKESATHIYRPKFGNIDNIAPPIYLAEYGTFQRKQGTCAHDFIVVCDGEGLASAIKTRYSKPYKHGWSVREREIMDGLQSNEIPLHVNAYN